LGSVFSPYYALARRHGDGKSDPLNHNAFNVALYSNHRKHWTMTERGRSAVVRTRDSLAIGGSSVRWEGERLIIQIEEISMPWLQPIRGTIQIDPLGLAQSEFALDEQQRHFWTPIAPYARASVVFERPGWRWQGNAYVDSNRGAVPLSRDFVSWSWSRAHLPHRRTAVLYDVVTRANTRRSLALRFQPDGSCSSFEAPPMVTLPNSAWRIARSTRCDDDARATVLQTFEDTPFYARSVLSTQLLGESAHSIHESLSLDRFDKPWVQAMLPFRMPRRWR
jgi:carotenoid 1,2-hydratase